MKTLQANNYHKAIKEIEALDKDLVGKIQEQIKVEDKDYFHVALVRITEKVGAVKNDVSIVVQHYAIQGFEKLQKNFMYQNISKLIVVHNPTEEMEEVEDDNKEVKQLIPTSGKTDAEIEEEIERRANAKANEIIANAGSQQATTGTQAPNAPPAENKMNLAELKEFAKANEIDLTGLTLKADIEKAVEAWKESQDEGQE